MRPERQSNNRMRTAAMAEALERRQMLTAAITSNPGLIAPSDIPATGSTNSVVIAFDQATTTRSGNLMQWTAAVQPAAGLNGDVPSGLVTFFDGTVAFGAANLAGGLATFATAALPVGTDSITAVYEGDANYAPSTSAATAIQVTGPAAGTPVITPAIGRVSLPTALEIGAKHNLNLPVVIDDTGGSSERGKITINVYASTGTTLDSNAVLVTTVPADVSVKPLHGKTMTAHLPGLPAALVAGTYHLLAQVVDAAGFAQTAVTSATIDVAAPFVSPVVTIVKTPRVVPAGEKTNSMAVLRITNNGNVAIAGTITMTLYLGVNDTNANKTQTNTVSVRVKIPAGRASSVSAALGAIPSEFVGDCRLIAVVATPLDGDVAATVTTAIGPNPVRVSAIRK